MARGGPNVTTQFDVRLSGPVFDGSFAGEARRAIEELEQEIGDEAVDRIQERLDTVLKNPTGFYRAHVRAHPVGEVVTIDDSNVRYGPWLEGVSSRNQSTSFKGYATFRKVFAELDQEVPRLADRVFARYVRRWN